MLKDNLLQNLIVITVSICLSACTNYVNNKNSTSKQTSQLTILINSPNTLPVGEYIYITGNFENWSGGKNKTPEFRAIYLSGSKYQITLEGQPGEKIEYKFTQGNWDKPELTRNQEETKNRSYTFTQNDSTIIETIEAWPTISEPVQIISHNTKLAGQLFLPESTAPKAVIIFVHGSGTHRGGASLARRLSGKGFAALYYDKRGVGDSGGVYVGEGNGSFKNLDLLSDDAAAAVKTLQKDSRFKNLPFGFFGNSQAGWIIPWAATKSTIDFFALWSGPVCTVSEETHFSRLAESDPKFWDKHTSEEVKDYMRTITYAQDDVDPLSSLEKLSIPGLWMLGEKDNSIPIDITIDRLNKLKLSGKTHYQYKVYKGAGHALNVPTLFEDTVSWLNHSLKNLH